jgi:hypothetical protein
MGKDPNQGEGDRASARRYDDHVREFIAGGKVGAAADSARKYVSHHPRDAARAERLARRGPHPWIDVDELVAKSRTLVDRVVGIAHRLWGKK